MNKEEALKVLNSKSKEIINETIALMKQDINTAKKNCENEAKAILESI